MQIVKGLVTVSSSARKFAANAVSMTVHRKALSARENHRDPRSGQGASDGVTCFFHFYINVLFVLYRLQSGASAAGGHKQRHETRQNTCDRS